jgi:hypothetical protein
MTIPGPGVQNQPARTALLVALLTLLLHSPSLFAQNSTPKTSTLTEGLKSQPPSETKYEECSKKALQVSFIQRRGASVRVVACGPSPLSQALNVVSREYGWLVDFEEPYYPSELDDCPTGCIESSIRTLFLSDYLEARDIRTSSTEEEKVLRKIVADYNQTANPGKFELRKEVGGRYLVVGDRVINSQGQTRKLKPVLDMCVSVPRQTRKVFETIDLIVRNLKEQGGIEIQPSYPSNSNAEDTVGGEDVPLRTLLAETLKTPGAGITWTFNCQPESAHNCSLSFSPYVAMAGKLLTEKALPLTYENSLYGISFEYPKHYVLTKGETDFGPELQLIGSDETQQQSGRVMLATVSMPEDAYPNSTLKSAFVNVSVNQHVTAEKCNEPLGAQDSQPNSALINGVKFKWANNNSAGAGTGYGDIDYVTFYCGTCYEITLGDVDESALYGGEWDNRITLGVDYEDVVRRLRAILGTLRIRPPNSSH